MSDTFCACVAGRRVPDADCGETLCKREPLPAVQLVVTGDIARAGGVWAHLPWRIYAERDGREDPSVRAQIRVAPRPGERADHVADVRIYGHWDEAQAICAALLWSRLRRGWV